MSSKKHTVIVALYAEYVNQLGLLPPRFTYEDLEIVIHHQPHITTGGGKFTFNADVLIESDVTGPDVFVQALLKGNHFHQQRLGKSTQAALLNSSSMINDLGLMSLPVYTGRIAERAGRYSLSTLHLLGCPEADNASHFVVKEEHGAKGENQAVVPRSQLYSFLDDTKHLGAKKVIEKYPDVIFSMSNDVDEIQDIDDKTHYFRNGGVFYMPLIENIAGEYRVLFGYKQVPLLFKRNIVERAKGYRQANFTLDTTVKESNKQNDIPLEHIDRLYQISEELMKVSGMFFGSIDVFYTEDGQWGIFEFCDQYGTRGIDVNAVSQHLQATIGEMVKSSDYVKQFQDVVSV